MTGVHQRLVTGVVDAIEAKSIDVWLSQEHPTVSILSCGPDTPSVLFSRLHPENILDGKGHIIHNDGSARTVIALPKQTTFRVKQNLKSSFLNYLKSFKARKEDIDLVIFMLASGTEDGQIKIGSKEMRKDELEKALRKFQGKITLIIIGCDGRLWKSERWDIITPGRPTKHASFPFFGAANSIFPQTDRQESCWASHSHPLKWAITEILNDLDDMNTCIRNYACSRIDLFDPLVSSETSSIPAYPRRHRTFCTALDLNPSRTHSKFTSPERLSVETIDGFLATRDRLITSGPNVYFQGFIARGAENPRILPEAEKALQFRSAKRNQTRRFVFLMDWAVDEDDEEAGIGFSDLAMDTVAPSSLCAVEIDQALGSEIFPQSVAPRTCVGGGQYSISHREPGWWAARHWARAGKPPINPNHFLYTMKRAGLVPNDDALLIVRAVSPFTVCDMELL
jgi:hypothetical protein